MRILYDNKKAHHEYEIKDSIEAGIQLEGWEVKSLKAGHAGLSGAIVLIKDNEAFLVNSVIPSWKSGLKFPKEVEARDRKLLIKKREVGQIASSISVPGITAIPLRFIENERGFIKLVIGIAKGRKKFDKRSKLKARDMQKRIDQDRKAYNF